MGAPIGNTNHTDGRVWRLAINRALEKRGKGDRMAALEELATVLVDQAGNGDLPALKEVGDRLDGKAAQTVDANVRGEMRLTLDSSDAGL